MILDESLELCDATAMSTVATGYALIGDQIPLSVARDIGVGQPPLYLVIQVTTSFTSGGAATTQFILASDASASIAVDGSATEHILSDAIALATLVAGAVFIYPLPMEGNVYEEYLGLIQNIGVAALTAGAINAFITADVSKWKAYPDAVN